jgi:uncharacterized membrane protein
MRLVSLLALSALCLAACGPADDGYDKSPPADAPAEPPAIAPNAWSGGFDLTGTEPFWAVQIRPDTLSLTRPDQPAVTVANPGVEAVETSGVWTTSAFTVKLTPGECSDGMSDRKYPYVAVVTTTDQGELKGCGAPPHDLSEAKP